jgi:hypothetical protein
MYPTATRYPGPAKASIFRQVLVRCTSTVRYTSARLGATRERRQPGSL